MFNYKSYQKSISNELFSIKDRVRYIIGDSHWGEEGRYKEIILSHVLRHHLPKGVSVGTGFVVNDNSITKQIDIIVYRGDYPLLFKQDDFIIAPSECVLGIIEVKSRVDTSIGCRTIVAATENGQIIGKRIFNGIFAFENRTVNIENIKSALVCSAGIVDNVCFGKDIFLKYWNAGMPQGNQNDNNNYSVYKIEDLAFGYFISNLVEDVYISMHGERIPDTLKKMFYPIENTKEIHRICKIEVGEL